MKLQKQSSRKKWFGLFAVFCKNHSENVAEYPWPGLGLSLRKVSQLLLWCLGSPEPPWKQPRHLARETTCRRRVCNYVERRSPSSQPTCRPKEATQVTNSKPSRNCPAGPQPSWQNCEQMKYLLF